MKPRHRPAHLHLVPLLLGLAIATFQTPAADPPTRPAQTSSPQDPFQDFVATLQKGQTKAAFALLDELPAHHPAFRRTMLQAGELLVANGQAEPALRYAQRAYTNGPSDIATVHAFIRIQVLARTNLSEPLAPRPLPRAVPNEFRFITDAPRLPAGVTDPSRPLSRRRVLADLDFLEVILANVYSYADRRGANWRGALDALRTSAATTTNATPLNTFALRLRRFLTLFGDPHTALRTTNTTFGADGGAAFLPVADGPRILALQPDRSAFLDNNCRYLDAIDGLPIDDWLRVAAHEVPQASPQWTRRETVAALRHLGPLRRELGLPLTNQVRLRLVSADNAQHRDITLPWLAKPARTARWPATQTRELDDRIGCLRIPSMDTDAKFLAGLDDAMARFRQTRGLVLDVRGNSGGSQDALRTLLPYFLEPTAPMRIVNVAAYRLPVNLPQPCTEGFLSLANRGLYPVTAQIWSPEQRTQISRFLSPFKPSWNLPPGKFSDWHVMGISASSNPKAFPYTNRVIVLMDAGCFSATDNFLGALQGLPRVTLLGTPSGGGSGRMTSYLLPNARLPLTVCQMASFRANGDLFDGHGVAPDVLLEPRPEDHLAHNADSLLSEARRRLEH